ncbi:unnamed protein product, partial [Iphiclides podalirius]
MKIKELKKTVNVSWSPAEHYPIMLAAGSAAQQVDASFSSNASLELYSLNLEEPGMDLELKSSLQAQHKFQKLVWSGAGVIVGGCDGGLLQFYNSEKLLSNSTEALVGSSTKHNGHVSALDINPYQRNLLASGASESEIFIWDLNNTSQPMAPGNKNQPFDHVQGLAWNQQVQHILGSTFANRCVVWDLRKNEPIMKLSDAQSRTRWRSLAWHPSVATQLCIASEDDQVPVVQLWDLRLAASPLVTLEGHQKGVLSLSWCRQDPDLLLSAGKDGRILCWNPNNTQPGGELVMEVSHSDAWVFEASWCPRSPALLASASFEQQVALHALLASPPIETSAQSQSSMLESFGGADALHALPAVARAPALGRAHQPQPVRAPRWLRRPAAARFAFGGKLVTFEKCPQEAGSQKLVYISQVVSDPQVATKAAELDEVLALTRSRDPSAANALAEYCRSRGDASPEQSERYAWFFLRASFLPTFRAELLNLLGFRQDEIPSKFKSQPTGDAPAADLAALSREAHTLIERKLANIDLEPTVSNVVIPNGDDASSLICRALVCGHVEEAAELCLQAGRVADCAARRLTGEELVRRVQRWHLAATARDPVSLLAGSVAQAHWRRLVDAAAPRSWKHALAALLAHCDDAALPSHCEMLGEKLSRESEPSLRAAATLCYACAARAPPQRELCADPAELARRAERALLLRCAAAARGRPVQAEEVDISLVQYASRLAEQGCLQSAIAVLQDTQHPLAQRLRAALQQHPQQQHQLQQQQQQTHQQNHYQHYQQQQVASGGRSAHGDGSGAFGSGVPLGSEASSWQAQRALRPPPAAPTPPIAGPVPAGGGITGRSKYKVDPSVRAAPAYGSYGGQYGAQYGGQYGAQPVTTQPQHYAGYNSPLPDHYGAASVPAPANTIAPINPAPLNPMNAMNPMSPMSPAPLNPTSPAPHNPATNGGYPADAPPARPVPPGWNDPPMMTSKPKAKQEVTAQPPITHPLFGVEPPQHVPLQGPMQPMQPMQAMQGMQPMQTQQPYVQSVAPPAPEPVAVQKPPLPEQFAPLQAVFDSLRNECLSKATNPQMKRKLEDIQRRLETLYDLLREYKLSEGARGALCACAELAAQGEWASALQQSAALASGADFAAAASFLPGLKLLLQASAQLQLAPRQR